MGLILATIVAVLFVMRVEQVLVWMLIAGILGALLAIPVAGIIQVVLRDVWDHRRGAPKTEPTIGEDQVPVDAAANPDDHARHSKSVSDASPTGPATRLRKIR